jgi:multidrug resistance protein
MVTAIGIIAVEETIVSTAMPKLAQALGGAANIGWIFSVYILTQIIASPISGRLSDLFGRTRVFMCGATLFLIGAFLAGSANSMIELVAARALQGIGAGAIQPIAYTVMADLYPGDLRGKMQGLISIVWTGAAIVGPLLGSIIVETLGWRWVFYVSVPFALGAMAFAFKLPQQSVTESSAVDWRGAALLASASAIAVYLLLEGAGLGLGIVSGLVAVCASLGGLLNRHLAVAKAPIIPLKVVKDRRIALSNGLGFLVGVAVMSCIAYLPTFCTKTLHFGPSKVALIILAVMLGWTLLAWGAGKLLALNVAVRSLTMSGSALMALGNALAAVVLLELTRAQATSGELGYAGAALIAAAALCGAGMGLATTTSMMAIQMYARPQDMGVATSLQLFFRLMGQVFGAALFGGALAMVQRSIAQPALAELANTASALAVSADVEAQLGGYIAIFGLASLAGVVALAVSAYLPGAEPNSIAAQTSSG